MGHTSTSFPASLPVLDEKNWNRWNIQMRAIMGFQEIAEIVEFSYPQLEADPSEQERVAYRENKRKDCKAMCLLHQCVDEAHFEKIASAQTSQEAWLILKKCNKGAKLLKKVRIQTMRRQYELMQMEPNEKIAQFFNRVICLTNQMKAYGESMADQAIIEKILRTLTPNFDHIVVAIEESKRLEDLKLEDLQGSLEAHEQRLIERSTDKVNQALQAQTFKKGRYLGRNNVRNRGRGRDFRGKNLANLGAQDQEGIDLDQASSYSKRGGDSNWREGKKKLDRRRIKCFNSTKMGHFSSECQSQPRHSDTNNRQHNDEAHMVKEDNEYANDDSPILLMMTTSQGNNSEEIWYVDSGCSNHMTGHREWLVNFDSSKKSRVKFADNRTI
ncbi:PREDICTED: uncharacterized protein LOC109339875 [Lupinus angustifolius]|uniref:uncharacterized protein LOC109339875 n=1 Tax=Lupinus angustifolius TaxID=3871 RepID=UPI00092F2DD8|nr:PREDICTED: uncharacterized protein LOC109339875 [Lupinus angustifolius]